MKDIILKRIELINWFGFEKFSLDFPSAYEIYYILGEHGVGKSSIYEGVFYSIFSKTTKDTTKKDIIRNGEKDFLNKCFYNVDGDEYIIERTKNKNKLYKNSKPIAFTNTQHYINEIFKISEEQFKQTVYFSKSKSHKPFNELNDNGKEEFINLHFLDNSLEILEEMAKSDFQEKTIEMEDVKRKIYAQDKQIEFFEEKIKSFNEKKIESENQYKRTITKFDKKDFEKLKTKKELFLNSHNSIQNLKNDIISNKDDIIRKEKEIDELEKKKIKYSSLENISIEKIEEVISLHSERKYELSSKNEKKSVLEKEIDELEKRIKNGNDLINQAKKYEYSDLESVETSINETKKLIDVVSKKLLAFKCDFCEKIIGSDIEPTVEDKKTKERLEDYIKYLKECQYFFVKYKSVEFLNKSMLVIKYELKIKEEELEIFKKEIERLEGEIELTDIDSFVFSKNFIIENGSLSNLESKISDSIFEKNKLKSNISFLEEKKKGLENQAFSSDEESRLNFYKQAEDKIIELKTSIQSFESEITDYENHLYKGINEQRLLSGEEIKIDYYLDQAKFWKTKFSNDLKRMRIESVIGSINRTIAELLNQVGIKDTIELKIDLSKSTKVFKTYFNDIIYEGASTSQQTTCNLMLFIVFHSIKPANFNLVLLDEVFSGCKESLAKKLNNAISLIDNKTILCTSHKQLQEGNTYVI